SPRPPPPPSFPTRRSSDLSRKEAGKLPHEAHELNTKVVNKIGLEADEILNKDIELNNVGAEKAAQDSASNYSSALMMVAVILGRSEEHTSELQSRFDLVCR